MKVFILAIIVSVLWSYATPAFANPYTNSIKVHSEISTLPQEYITQVQLMRNSISQYKNKISTLSVSYNAENDAFIIEKMQQLDHMIESLKLIQKRRILHSDADSIQKLILSDLKILNARVKVYLEDKKRKSQRLLSGTKERYSTLSVKINTILDSFISRISKELLKNDTLNSSEKEIIRHLIEIQKINDRISTFSEREFTSEEDMKAFIQDSLRSLRSEFKELNAIIKGEF